MEELSLKDLGLPDDYESRFYELTGHKIEDCMSEFYDYIVHEFPKRHHSVEEYLMDYNGWIVDDFLRRFPTVEDFEKAYPRDSE